MSDWEDHLDEFDPPEPDIDTMSKKALRRLLRELQEQAQKTYDEFAKAQQKHADQAAELRKLRAEVEQMKAHWRPVPITHEWQPKNPQCALCDEPRDAARHRVDTA